MVYTYTQFNGVGELYSFLNSLKRRDQSLAVQQGSELAETLGIDKLEISMDGGNRDMVCIDRIAVRDRGRGDGTRLMTLICKWADENGKTLTLTPSDSMGATSVGRLERFYRRFGFVSNRGRNADFSTRNGMYRRPKT